VLCLFGKLPKQGSQTHHITKLTEHKTTLSSELLSHVDMLAAEISDRN